MRACKAKIIITCVNYFIYIFNNLYYNIIIKMDYGGLNVVASKTSN